MWVSLRVHSWGPEVSHRLPDSLPPPWGPRTQSGRGPQYPCCFLVYWRSHYPSGGQHQSGGPAEKLLLWQEDDDNTCRIVTASDPGFITFFIRTLACVLRVSTNINAELKLDHIELPGSTIWHVILVQHWHSSKLYAKEVWVKRLCVNVFGVVKEEKRGLPVTICIGGGSHSYSKLTLNIWNDF